MSNPESKMSTASSSLGTLATKLKVAAVSVDTQLVDAGNDAKQTQQLHQNLDQFLESNGEGLEL